MDGVFDTLTQAAEAAGTETEERGTRSHALFSGLSQELCRPLISLRAGFDLLLAGSEGPVSAEQRTHLEGLRGQCDDLIRLTRTFLDYAGLTRSSRPLELAPFRLAALVEETRHQFQLRAERHEIQWECTLKGEDATVEIDLDAFQQILARLVDNAFSHTPPGGRTAIVASADRHSWQMSIRDDGTGIPPAEVERVFEPLVRLGSACNPSNAAARSGLGMGLAVCRELVHMLGGTIKLESLPEAGTQVTIAFARRPPTAI